MRADNRILGYYNWSHKNTIKSKKITITNKILYFSAWPLRRHDAFALTVSMLGQGLSFYYYELNCLKVFYSALHHKVELLAKSSKRMDLLPSQTQAQWECSRALLTEKMLRTW